MTTEGTVEGDAPEWRVTGRVREIIESTVSRGESGEWVTIDPIFLGWLWADFLKLEAMNGGVAQQSATEAAFVV